MKVEWIDGKPQFYISSILDDSLTSKVSVGDVVVSLNSVSADDILKTYHQLSNGNNWYSIARGIAKSLSTIRSEISHYEEGDKMNWIIRKRESNEIVEVKSTLQVWSPQKETINYDESSIGIDNGICPENRSRNYGAYDFVSHGINWCLYTSKEAPYSEYPILRFHSFYYSYVNGQIDPRPRVRTDYYHLRAQLKNQNEISGIILDLRDNNGGNSPYWFLDWFASQPYNDTVTQYPFYEDFVKFPELDTTKYIQSQETDPDYLRAKEERKEGQRFYVKRSLDCHKDKEVCSNLITPKHQITEKPIALLVGMGCMSSCDSFASTFSREELGPIVGEPTAAAHTNSRLYYDVRTSSGMSLGKIKMIPNRDVDESGHDVGEGMLLVIDYPLWNNFETLETYDSQMVNTALKALQDWEE